MINILQEGVRMKRIFCVVIAVLIFAIGACAFAQSTDYPARPITLQVPWVAGGGTDVGARILAAITEKKIGQSIVVVNKPGAGSQMGLTELARQKADGYYLGFISTPHICTIILDPDRKAAFTLDSFVPVISQVMDPGLIWVKADSPYKTLKDLIEDGKKRPGAVRASTTGIMSDDHLAILMVQNASGARFRIVHFEGGAQQLTATLGGQVDVSFDNVGSVVQRIKGGQVRGLAVMDKERSKFLPEVPTAGELGFPTVISSSTRGVMGPKGIPKPILTRLETAFTEAMKDSGHIEKMETAGLSIKMMVGDNFGKYLQDLFEQCKPLVEEARKSQ
jgi:tripartite-type tricarboxylate transporter receptor subunit TctC